MAVLTPAAALAIAVRCVGPALAPVMVGVAEHESGLQPFAIHDNATGRSYSPDTQAEAIRIASALISAGHDIDAGIGQVNVRNWSWLGLTMQTALDPCRNLAAGARVLLVKYNGNPPDAGKIAYASDVLSRIGSVDVPGPPAPSGPPPPPPCAPAWDAWALAACSKLQASTHQSVVASQEPIHAN